MFYNINTNQILNNVPLSGYTNNGVLVQGLNITDAETQKNCGILPVKNDSPSQPQNTIEDISNRSVIIEEDGVIINRVWIQTPIIIPETISARQIRLWLIDNNISLSSVENAIKGIVDEKLREKTLVEWEYAPYIERNHPLIESLASSLGLNGEQIDQGFIRASVL
jgi:hypothetical protein